MTHSLPRLTPSFALVVAVAVLAGCGHSTPGSPWAGPKPAQRVNGAKVAPSGANVGPTVTADVRACAGAQAVMGHLASSTARWSPNLDPFDKAISAQIRLQSVNLAKQAPRAVNRHLGEVVQSNAGALATMAAAMTGKDQAKVNRSIKATQVAYRELKKVCAL